MVLDLDLSLTPEHCRSEIQAILDENKRVDALPILACYSAATVGSRTAKGGVVKENGFDCFIDGHSQACTGDLVVYPNGSTATIISGAGEACLFDNERSAALVGSHLSNGDIITESLSYGMQFFILEGQPPIKGFLKVNYIPEQIG